MSLLKCQTDLETDEARSFHLFQQFELVLQPEQVCLFAYQLYVLSSAKWGLYVGERDLGVEYQWWKSRWRVYQLFGSQTFYGIVVM